MNDLDNLFVGAEGVVQVSNIDRPAGENGTIVFDVDVIDSQLNLEFGDSDTSNPSWAVNRISIDQLEDFSAVDLTQTEFFYDLGSEDSVLFNGNSDPYVRLPPLLSGDISFVGGNPRSFDRGATTGVNNINRDGVLVSGGTTFNHLIGDGVWSVLVNIGDRDFARDDITLSAEGQTFFTDVDRAVSSFGPNLIFEVPVSDGELNLSFEDLGGVNNDISITRIILERVGDLPEPASVLGRQVFYNNSFFDGNDATANSGDDAAIATDKTALLPGQTASFDNYTSFVNGINGIIVDINNLANPGALSASDFVFATGNGSSLSDFTSLAAAPTVSVRPGEGAGGSDRVTLIFADEQIRNTWLSVSVLANTNTGLSQNDVFYFGNLIGDTGNDTGFALVTATDESETRDNHRNFTNRADVENIYDFNRDSLVTAIDESIARNDSTSLTNNFLRLIAAPNPNSQPFTAANFTLALTEDMDQGDVDPNLAPATAQLPEPGLVSPVAVSVAPVAQPVTVSPSSAAPLALQSPDFLTPQTQLEYRSTSDSRPNLFNNRLGVVGIENQQERLFSNNDLVKTETITNNDLLNDDFYPASVEDKGQQTDQLFETFGGETLFEIDVFHF